MPKPLSLLRTHGMSLTQVMVGMGVGSMAMLAGIQFMEINMKSNRSVQLAGDFNALSATVQQLLMTPNVCSNVLKDQVFLDQNAAQNVTLKNPSGTPATDFVSTAQNPYAPGLKITSITLKKLSGASNKYFTQLELRAQKQGQVMGGKELATTLFVNLETDPSNKIIACAGGGDYVRRTGDTMTGHLIIPEPTASNHPATKAYVDASGGGGGGGACYESPYACLSSYQNAGTIKRYQCTWGYYGSSTGSAAAAVTNSIVPCSALQSDSGRYFVGRSTEISLNLCCK